MEKKIKQVPRRSKETKPKTKRKRSCKKKRNETVVMRSQVDITTMKTMLEIERLFTSGIRPKSECAYTQDIQTRTISSYVDKESSSIQERVIESVANKIMITRAKEMIKGWNKRLTPWSYYGREGRLYPEDLIPFSDKGRCKSHHYPSNGQPILAEKDKSFYQDECIHFQDNGYHDSRKRRCIQDRGKLASTAGSRERKMVSDKYSQCSIPDSDLSKPARNKETKKAFNTTISPVGNDEDRVGPSCSLATVCSDRQEQPSRHEPELDNLENAISIKKLVTVGKTKMQNKRSNKPSALSFDDSASQADSARDEKPQLKTAKDKLDQCLIIKDIGCTYDGRQNKLPGRKLTPWQNNAARRRGPNQRPQWTGQVQSRAATRSRCGQDMTGWESDATAFDSVDLNPLQHADGHVQCKNSLASYTYRDVHKIAMTDSCAPALLESPVNQMWRSPSSLPSSCDSSIRLTPPLIMTDGERTFSDESTDRESSTPGMEMENGEENNRKSENSINEDNAEKNISHISPRKRFSSKHDMVEDFLLFYEDSPQSNTDNATGANKTKDTHTERSDTEEGHTMGRGRSRDGGVLGCDSKGTRGGGVLGCDSKGTRGGGVLGCDSKGTRGGGVLGCDSKGTRGGGDLGCDSKGTRDDGVLGCDSKGTRDDGVLRCDSKGTRDGGFLGCDSKGTRGGGVLGCDSKGTRDGGVLGCDSKGTRSGGVLGCDSKGTRGGGVLGCDSKGTQSGIGKDETKRKDIGIIRNTLEKQLVNDTRASEKQNGSKNYHSQDESRYSTPVMGEHDNTATIACDGEGDRSLQARDYLSSHVNYNNEHVGLQDDSHGTDSPYPFKLLKGSGDCTLGRDNIASRFVGEEARLSISRTSTPFSDRIVNLLRDSESPLEKMVVKIISKKPTYARANAAPTTTAPRYNKALRHGAHIMKRTGGRAESKTGNLWEYSQDPYPLSIVSSTSLFPDRTFDLPVYFVPKVQPSDPIDQVTPTTTTTTTTTTTAHAKPKKGHGNGKRVGRDRAPGIQMQKPMIDFHKFDRGMSDVDSATSVAYSSKPDEKLEFCNDLREKSIVFLSQENKVVPPPFPKPCPQIPNFIPMKRQQTHGNLVCKKTDTVKATGPQSKWNTNATPTVARARNSAPTKIKRNPLPSFIERNIQSVRSAHDKSKCSTTTTNPDKMILHLPQIHCFDDNGVQCGVESRAQFYPYYKTSGMPTIRGASMLKSDRAFNGYYSALGLITSPRSMKTGVGSSVSLLSDYGNLKLPDIE